MKISKMYNDLFDMRDSRLENEFDEAVVFAYEALKGIWQDKEFKELTCPKALCKIKTKPRYFEKCYMSSPETARIYYWSRTLGGHVFTPFWKRKDGAYYMDQKESMEKARKAANEEGTDFINPELGKILDFLNKGKNKGDGSLYHYKPTFRFEESGYIREEYSWNDCSSYYFGFYYRAGAFFIESSNIEKISIFTCSDKGVNNSKIMQTVNGAKWSKEELFEFIMGLNSYYTGVHITYRQGEAQKTEAVRMDGNRIHTCSEMFGLKGKLEEIWLK